MSYYENLRGVLQTKLDALNSMDQFRNVARMAKEMPRKVAPANSVGGKSSAWGLVLGATVLLALAAITEERKS